MPGNELIRMKADHVRVTWVGGKRYSIMFSRRVGGGNLQCLMEYGFDEVGMERVLQHLSQLIGQHNDIPDARVDPHLETIADAVAEPVSQITLSIASCRIVCNKIQERLERVRQGLERPQQNIRLSQELVN